MQLYHAVTYYKYKYIYTYAHIKLNHLNIDQNYLNISIITNT